MPNDVLDNKAEFAKRVIDFCYKTKVEDPFVVADGLPRSILEDKYARKSRIGNSNEFQYETWEDIARRVVTGNNLLVSKADRWVLGFEELEDQLRLSIQGVMCYSGRHLQHGDIDQPNKLMDMFSNCTSSPFSFLTLWKSLCGCGVSSDYSSHVRPVNWDNMPNFRLVLNGGPDDSGDVEKGAHPDFKRAINEFQGGFESLREAQHKYPSSSEWVRWFKVEDSREGWAQIICALETAAYHEIHKDKLFIFDLSDIRCEGTPIMGHQGRPASGPIPLMRCLLKVATIKGAFMDPWKQAMYVDDYMSYCVSIGGVRRIARQATMWWEDSNIMEFIEIKRGGHLRMANNAILVDQKFHDEKKDPRTKAFRIHHFACASSYLDGTGEPGTVNVHKMRQNREGLDQITAQNYLNIEPSGLYLHPRTYDLMEKVLTAIKNGPYICFVNPCGEADLGVHGDDCIVGDVGLQNAKSLKDAQRAAELMGRSLVRVSGLMPAICQAERNRTNKVGVSFIGALEWFWNHYKLGFYDLLKAHDYFMYPPNSVARAMWKSDIENRAITAWLDFGSISEHAVLGALDEAQRLGLTIPDVSTLSKPGGTVAKLFQATESANLPNRRYDLRFTQHLKMVIIDGVEVENPKVTYYRKQGYPIKDISHKYAGYCIVGFPRANPYVKMLDETGASNKVVTANNVSMEDHYKWLRLLEYHWLGTKENGEPANGQISYTLKYNPNKVSFEDFVKIIGEQQPTIRTCTFATTSSDEEVLKETEEMIENYGWIPEHPITKEVYDYYMSRIERGQKEEYSDEELMCDSGFCSIDGNIN